MAIRDRQLGQTLCARRDRHGRRRRCLHARDARHLDIAARVAVLALGGGGGELVGVLLVLLAAVGSGYGGGGGQALGGDLDGGLGLGGRDPAVDLPLDTGEGLEPEATLVPLAAGLAGAVESTQSGIDGALVSLGAQAVGVAAGGLEGTIFPGRLLAYSARLTSRCTWCTRGKRALTFAVSS